MLLISILTTVDNTVKECKLMNMHCKKKKNSYWVCSIQPAYCRRHLISDYRNSTGQAKIG